jgi:hypothetical protein
MEELVGRTASTELRPWAFLVAWDGVLTLAYRGFPRSLVDLKQHIGHHFPELPPENPGSKWPKTTLGALAEGAPPLTLAQLRTLKRVCDECSAELRLPGTPAMPVDQLAVVVFCCASLEKRLITHRIDLLRHTGDVAAADIGCSLSAGMQPRTHTHSLRFRRSSALTIRVGVQRRGDEEGR